MKIVLGKNIFESLSSAQKEENLCRHYCINNGKKKKKKIYIYIYIYNNGKKKKYIYIYIYIMDKL